MKTMRRNVIELFFARIATLLSARFGKPSVAEMPTGVMWYISKDGNDMNSGKSPDDAFRTSSAAMRAATADPRDTLVWYIGE